MGRMRQNMNPKVSSPTFKLPWWSAIWCSQECNMRWSDPCGPKLFSTRLRLRVITPTGWRLDLREPHKSWHKHMQALGFSQSYWAAVWWWKCSGPPLGSAQVGNNALKIMDWILEDMASSQRGGDEKDLRNAPFGIGFGVVVKQRSYCREMLNRHIHSFSIISLW